MHEFRLTEVVGGDHAGPHPAIEILVDGRPLRDLILSAEGAVRPEHDERTWEGDLNHLPIDDRYLASWAELPDDRDVGRWLPIYTCGCGVFGCGGFVARMTRMAGDVVMWSDFADAYWYASAGWDEEEGAGYPIWRRVALATLGPFHFDDGTYRRVIGDFMRSAGGAR